MYIPSMRIMPIMRKVLLRICGRSFLPESYDYANYITGARRLSICFLTARRGPEKGSLYKLRVRMLPCG